MVYFESSSHSFSSFLCVKLSSVVQDNHYFIYHFILKGKISTPTHVEAHSKPAKKLNKQDNISNTNILWHMILIRRV